MHNGTIGTGVCTKNKCFHSSIRKRSY